MIQLQRTDSTNEDFRRLVVLLNAYLAEVDGEEHAFYAQYNTLDQIRHVVLAFQDGEAVGCGAFKAYSPDTVEIKRMFVHPLYRGRGVATLVLLELEQWARELNYSFGILETGKKQSDAVALYTKNQYELIPNFGQYAGMEASVCFKKRLRIAE